MASQPGPKRPRSLHNIPHPDGEHEHRYKLPPRVEKTAADGFQFWSRVDSALDS